MFIFYNFIIILTNINIKVNLCKFMIQLFVTHYTFKFGIRCYNNKVPQHFILMLLKKKQPNDF